MKSTAYLPVAVLLVFVSRAAAQDEKSASPKLTARVDSRVELMSLIFRLAGNNEYNQPLSKSPYADEVDAHFAAYRDHPVVTLARELRRQHGVSYDAVMSMAVHLEDTQTLKASLPLEPRPERLDERWPPDQTREFLERARSFVKDSGFSAFCQGHQQLYDAAARRMTQKLGEKDYVGWFDKFFGQRPTARFYVIVSLLNGPCNYGSGIQFPDGREEITPIIGAAHFDGDGVPVFKDDDVGTIAHEFCHSYTNPFVDKYADRLKPAGQRIYKRCEQAMKQQAYGNWTAMMRESLVRACVVRFLHTSAGDKAARAEVQDNQQRGFRWIGKLADLLGDYETQRTRYAAFDDFMPRLIDFFEQYARESEVQAANAPKVVRMIPVNGAEDVDPALTEIKVFFDRPMKVGGWAVVGGGPHFPEANGDCHYDADRKVFSMPVRLKPHWSYQCWLNRDRFNGFQSDDGVELESVEVNFTTRAQ